MGAAPPKMAGSGADTGGRAGVTQNLDPPDIINFIRWVQVRFLYLPRSARALRENATPLKKIARWAPAGPTICFPLRRGQRTCFNDILLI